MNAQLVPSSHRPYLFEAEQELMTLIEMEEEAVSPEDQATLQAVIQEQLHYNVEKRERFGNLLLWADYQQEIAKREIERLRQHAKRMEAMSERMRRYGVAAIRALGTDEKGKFRRLLGHTVSLFVRALPVSVEIKDPDAVPDVYKRVTVQLPAATWLRLVEDNPVLAGTTVKAVDISKEEIRHSIEAGLTVEGADLKLSGHDFTLVVK